MPLLRRAVFALWALMLTGIPAHAGEFSEFRPLGFSADGGVFAFEEFGVQDGSGFAFANRFFINTSDDSFLPGSTVRVVIEDEAATVADARTEAATQSSTLEQQYGFSENPGVIATFNPLSDLNGSTDQLRYLPMSMVPQPFGAYTAQLTEKQLPPTASCASITETSLGFRLEMTEANGEPASIVLHEDAAVPNSRNCPTGYRLGGAITHYADGIWTHAVLVLVRSLGFEGENGRWIAVTRRFE
ncbi:DUF2259 domain-containing protein [Hoeflea sp. Naph1]|uniref:DUF2259 domain-containing protein n=1 Tax=Hoeflea sp. Naph1 TaxID=3388653 RepID=UPI00398FB258